MHNDVQHWSFLSNHAHVLICIARDATVRVRDIALTVGITERAVQRILGELEDARVIRREREGRRNHYAIDGRRHLRHKLESNHTVKELRYTGPLAMSNEVCVPAGIGFNFRLSGEVAVALAFAVITFPIDIDF
ncbi:MAG: winged helix-turn-helix transcriptional regulator [Myxococcales bacterium]|nr:MAG: winged helix-turn-helix transcriptional regulator [Myxococcales bacterium]